MNYDIASIPGDGIGPEVVDQAVAVALAAAKKFGFSLKINRLPFGAGYFLKNSLVLPPQALEQLGDHSALLLGAVGDPRVPPGPLEQELLLALRFHFDQYLNLRPAKSYPNAPVPIKLRDGETIDIAVVRENTEDFYMGLGRSAQGSIKATLSAKRGLYDFKATIETQTSPELPMAFSLGLMTEPGIERVARKAFNLAKRRGQNFVHLATKSNAIPQLYGFWDKTVAKVAQVEFPEIELIPLNVDNLCYQLPRAPLDYGVILCPNLFGDIVSDLVSALAGGLGLAASGNIGEGLCMFEPVHGSAPKLAGTGRANPLAAILSAAMLLEHLKEFQAAQAVRQAVTDYLTDGVDLPHELGGSCDCQKVGQLVVKKLLNSKSAETDK
ncbi:MAG: isocitrate/isopropylmalate dehydrogenase family protein [Deltaproteobacteria bacterium]|jgi:3-isopropylmalate dehydrogenase|nr:isocitrate/isopropylmalate dehydrogenase family protein [Deltaproteobacteria bacterium]